MRGFSRRGDSVARRTRAHVACIMQHARICEGFDGCALSIHWIQLQLGRSFQCVCGWVHVSGCSCVRAHMRACVHDIWDRYFVQSLPNLIIFKPCVLLRRECFSMLGM